MKTLTVKIIIAVLAILTIGATVTTIIIVNNNEDPLVPDYNPVVVEPNAETMSGTDEKLEAPDGGGAVNLIYSKAVTIDLTEKSVTLMFGNPSKSTQNLAIQLVIDGKVITQSGLLKPGNRVTKLTLNNDLSLTTGEKTATFLVSFYNEESNERAVLKTEVTGVTVTIK